MSIRRVLAQVLRLDGAKPVAACAGMAGEEFESEIYQPYGFSTNPTDGQHSPLLEVNGDPNNYITLPPGGYKLADEGTTEIYYNETRIVVSDGGVSIFGDVTVRGDIVATGDIRAGTVSLKTHVHTGVRPGGGTSGPPL